MEELPEVKNTQKSMAIARLSQELWFKAILFLVSIIIFIAISVTLIYMALCKYDVALVVAIGISDGLIGVILTIITRSLFKTKT